MPSKKKKYNARFPAGRIKKIMQSDEEIGKVAQAVPVIISRTLELFVESLLNKTLKITNSRNAKTLSTSHMKQCIMSEQRFDFLRELVKNIPDISVAEEAANYNEDEPQSSPEENYPDSDTPYDLSMPSTSTQATRACTTNGSNVSTAADYAYRRQQAVQRYAENGSSGAITSARDEQSRAHLKRESEIMQRLRQRISAAAQDSAIPSSVIMHTTSLSTAQVSECLPAKLCRMDSAPAAAAGSWQQQQQQQPVTPSTRSTNTTHQRQRLKHQSQSVPSGGNHVQDSSSNSTASPHMPQTPTQHQSLPPIPAPIVSIDFCNKPVVKIDYSNLSMPPAKTNAPAAPLSAPATIAATTNASAFNFNPEPVISIDLSNMVGTTSSAISNQPAVATISIGSIAAIPTIPNTLVAAPTKSPNNTNAIKSALSNSSLASATSSLSSSPSSSSSSAAAAKKANSFFELDEDYDNI